MTDSQAGLAATAPRLLRLACAYSAGIAMRFRAAILLAVLVSCTEYQAFDSVAFVREQLADRIGADRAASVDLPFELRATTLEAVVDRLDPTGSETRRAANITDFVFQGLDLQYRLYPTRDAEGTLRRRSGNCLSFTNLFVALARWQRLNAFYVEVHDAQRWDFHNGTVVSQGHIVAGVTLDGRLTTYDFLPYRPKAYRDFHPIDDFQATAHYYNNLGAEALLSGDLQRARELIELAAGVAPEFTGALNNLGVVRARGGDVARALEAYERGLAVEPDNVPILTNLVRLYQQTGETARANELLARIDDLKVDNPYFYIYQAELALGGGEERQALEHLAKALQRAPELPEVHVALVKAFLALGNVERARHHLGRALQLDATHPEARRLARLLDSSSG